MKQINLEVRNKKIIEVDGFQFKDLNGNGMLDKYEDWRLSPEERAKDLISKMEIDEKIGMMMIKTQKSGYSQNNKKFTSHDGILDEEVFEDKNIFIGQINHGTTAHILDTKLRHFIFRENIKEDQIAKWVNALNEVAESSRLGIPVLVASNSRNENAERTFGMNDAVGVFSTFPSTLGLASIYLGDKALGRDAGKIFDDFARVSRKEWTASGLRKGYMYMIDTATDPRWQRFYGTFGEDVNLIKDAAKRLVLGFQGEVLGKDSVSLTMKHFPGGGARENGFDPHYAEGKWNIYSTKGSLEKYHLPPFEIVSKYAATSIMPYYSIPSHEKSEVQLYKGKRVPFEPVGFAFNNYLINNILREQLNFKGYINSDSGILDNMAWGVDHLPKEERAAFAINNGVDLISDTNEVEWIKKAYEKGLIKENRIDEANFRLLVEMFKLGLFDDKTYVDPKKAVDVINSKESVEIVNSAHQKSVVLLKNSNKTLPIKEKSKVYIEFLHKDVEVAKKYLDEVNKSANKYFELVNNPEDAENIIIFITPKSGNYFSATPGLLELSLCENKISKALDGTKYTETTVSNISRVEKLSNIAHKTGGKLVVSVNSTMPWLLSNVEIKADALLSHFETFFEAQFEVITGKVNPIGKLPFTFPKDESVIAVDESGKCASPNDVPGYDKDKYMVDGMTYAYIDNDGNVYKLGHGLTY